MRSSFTYCLLSFICLMSFQAQSGVYREVDREGNVTYTDQPEPNAQPVNMRSGEVETTSNNVTPGQGNVSSRPTSNTVIQNEVPAATVTTTTSTTAPTAIPTTNPPAVTSTTTTTTTTATPPLPAGPPAAVTGVSQPQPAVPSGTPGVLPNASPAVTPQNTGAGVVPATQGTPNTGTNAPVMQPSKTPVKTNPQPNISILKKKPPIYSISLIKPNEDQTFQNGEDVVVQVTVTPQLEMGDNIVVYVDGAPATEPTNDTSITVPRLDRGSHTVQARIIQPNGTGAETQIVNIFQQRTSVLLPPNRVLP